MLTAFASAVVGLFGSVLPDIVSEVKDSRDHTRELELINLSSQLQIRAAEAGMNQRIEEANTNLMVEEVRAYKESLKAIIENQFKPVGIPWIDGFNAVLRPATAALIIILFVGVATAYTVGIMSAYANSPDMSLVDLSNAIWFSMVGESIQAVLGFLFGYRCRHKKVASQ